MLYAIKDNINGIMIQHKSKNYLLKKYFNNELEIEKTMNYKVVNKVIKEYYTNNKTILLIEIGE